MKVYVVNVYSGEGWLPIAVCDSEEKANTISDCHKEFSYTKTRIDEFDTDKPIEDYYNVYRFCVRPMEFTCNPIYEYLEGKDNPIGEIFGYGNYKNVYLTAPNAVEAIKKGYDMLSEYVEKVVIDKTSCHYRDEYDAKRSCYYTYKNGEWVKND